MIDDTAASERQHADELRLVRLASSGDRVAFRKLMESHQRPLQALVTRLSRHPDDVEDILQEILIRAWRGLPSFREEARFSTWLYRIAVNTTWKWHRSHGREKDTIAIDLIGEDVGERIDSSPMDYRYDPAETVQRNERREKLLAALDTLPEKQRRVIAMHYLDGATCDEIADAVGCSIGTVWSRLHYACKRLRPLLKDL